jgi:hypothetical protein
MLFYPAPIIITSLSDYGEHLNLRGSLLLNNQIRDASVCLKTWQLLVVLD